ncbi:hypothetical protein BDP27DRAFT_1453329 [Rhodocollybia butyracea]|uniref:Uncharacterized protein n=1 Tax=Rhodocollybia butyracea TaxID=206335 RepID=A0A9P5TYK0_9AGAR|nr:hypothetical protein BDP27DRAFT_1453329 [Rhodocollybia butyracea]
MDADPPSAYDPPNAPGPLKSQLDLLDAKGWLSGMFSSKPKFDSSQPVELSGINTKVVTELAGPAWSDNSCWLDSSMEAIYCALVYHNGFKDFETIVSEVGIRTVTDRNRNRKEIQKGSYGMVTGMIR